MLRYVINCGEKRQKEKRIYKVIAYIHTESLWKVKKKQNSPAASQEGNRLAREQGLEDIFQEILICTFWTVYTNECIILGKIQFLKLLKLLYG